MLIKLVITLTFIVTLCKGFERDENYYNNENDTIVGKFARMMKISDYKIPAVDHLDYISVISSKMLDVLPPFELSGVGVSKECRRSSQEFLKALEKFEIWALKMHDSTAKLTSGLLNGHVNNYGDFDQCLETVSQSSKFKGQYCLAHIQPSISSDFRYMNYLRTLTLSFEAYKSKLRDPSHVIPKTSQINWALCVPSTCTHKDVEIVLSRKLKNFFNDSRVQMEVEVRKGNCQVMNEDWKIETGAKLAIAFVAIIILISVLSTFYEIRSEAPKKNEWFTAFSLKKNYKDLISIDPPRGDIPSPHGIRFINTVMLIISHKCMELDFSPIPNRTSMSLTSKSARTVVVRASYLYTDSFILLSGMLVAYSFVGRLQRGQNINIIKEIAARYFRVIPPVAALMLFGTFLLPLLGSGPQWDMLITYQSELCKQTWWRNFLMIHNWFGFENICMTHTHHVGNDFGLFLLAPFVIISLYKYPAKASIAIFLLSLASTIARFWVTYQRDMTVYVMFGLDISKLYEIASHMYILPHYRFTVYSIGLALGYILRTYKHVKLTKNQLNFGWFIATVGFLGTLALSAMMSFHNYKFNIIHAAIYSSLAPLPWCFFFSWAIFTAQLGYKNFFIKFLEWKGFLISTKLSYGIYLMQFAVFHYNVGTVRTPSHFGVTKSLININELLCIVFASSILTLFFDSPFGNLKKLIFDSKKEATVTKATLDINANEVGDDTKLKSQ